METTVLEEKDVPGAFEPLADALSQSHPGIRKQILEFLKLASKIKQEGRPIKSNFVPFEVRKATGEQQKVTISIAIEKKDGKLIVQHRSTSEPVGSPTPAKGPSPGSASGPPKPSGAATFVKAGSPTSAMAKGGPPKASAAPGAAPGPGPQGVGKAPAAAPGPKPPGFGKAAPAAAAGPGPAMNKSPSPVAPGLGFGKAPAAPSTAVPGPGGVGTGKSPPAAGPGPGVAGPSKPPSAAEFGPNSSGAGRAPAPAVSTPGPAGIGKAPSSGSAPSDASGAASRLASAASAAAPPPPPDMGKLPSPSSSPPGAASSTPGSEPTGSSPTDAVQSVVPPDAAPPQVGQADATKTEESSSAAAAGAGVPANPAPVAASGGADTQSPAQSEVQKKELEHETLGAASPATHPVSGPKVPEGGAQSEGSASVGTMPVDSSPGLEEAPKVKADPSEAPRSESFQTEVLTPSNGEDSHRPAPLGPPIPIPSIKKFPPDDNGLSEGLLSPTGTPNATIDVVEVAMSCREISSVLVTETKASGADGFFNKAISIPWARFTLLWILCGIASGLLPGQALWVKLFADAGVFRAVCEGREHDNGEESTCTGQFIALTTVFQTCQCISVVFIAPIGLFYDRWGARNVGVAGACLCSIGLFMVWLSLLGAAAGKDFGTSVLFSLAVLICDFGAMLNSFSFMGLIWHFPGRQALVLSLINGTYQVSSFLPIIVELLMNSCGMPLASIVFVYSILVASIIYVLWRLIPTQAEYYRQARRLLGIPLPAPPKEFRVRYMLSRAWMVLQRDIRDHVVCGLAIAVGYTFPGFYASLTAPYGEELFGQQSDGDRLAQLYVAMNGIVGLCLGTVFGAVADRYGLQAFVVVLAVILCLASLTCGLQSWVAQFISALMLVLWNSLFQLFVYRYLLHYAPPNRFGAVQGVYTFALMCVSLPITFASLGLVGILPDGPDAYRIPMYVLGTTGTIATSLYAYYYRVRPPPEVPCLLEEDEAELAKNFGCGNLDEVMEVVRIPTKKHLVRMLSSTDPEVMHQLIRSIDTDKMMDMMTQRSVDDLAAMMDGGIGDDAPEDEGEDFEKPCGTTLRGVGKYSPLAMDEAPPPIPVSNRIGKLMLDKEPLVGNKQAIAMRNPVGRLVDICKCGFLGGRSTRGRPAQQEDETESSAKMEAERSRIQGLGDFFVQMIADGDKMCVTNYLLKESVEDMWKVTEDLEQRQTEAEQRKTNAEFEKLIPPKDFAVLLRQRPELRTFVQRLIKRNVDRKIGSSWSRG